MTICIHLDTIRVLPRLERPDGFDDCLRERGVWLHLRICLTCGHVVCCDDSPHRHATARHQTSGHALIHSLEPGEN